MKKLFNKILKRLFERRNLYLINKKYAGTNPKHFVKKLKAIRRLGYKVGDNTKIVGPIYVTTDLEIGENCWIGRNFQCHGNGKVLIGNNCDFAPDVTCSTGGHFIGSKERRAGEGRCFDISIGNGCWIGTRSTIINGANVGDGSVVAACGVVISDVPSNTMVAGNPAKVKKGLSDE